MNEVYDAFSTIINRPDETLHIGITNPPNELLKIADHVTDDGVAYFSKGNSAVIEIGESVENDHIFIFYCLKKVDEKYYFRKQFSIDSDGNCGAITSNMIELNQIPRNVIENYIRKVNHIRMES